MPSDILRACQRSGRIITAQGQEVDPADVITRACTIYGDRLVMQAILRSTTGDTLPIVEMIDSAVTSILNDIELELRD